MDGPRDGRPRPDPSGVDRRGTDDARSNPERWSAVTREFATLSSDVDRPVARLLWRYGAGRRGVLAAATAATVVWRLSKLLYPLLLGVAVDVLFGAGRSVAVLPVGVGSGTTRTQLAAVTGLFLALVVVNVLAGAVRVVAWRWFATGLGHDLRTDAVAATTRLGLAALSGERTGDVTSVLAEDVDRVSDLVDDGLQEVVQTVAFFAGLVPAMLLIHLPLALVTTAFVLPTVAVAGGYRRVVESRHDDRRSAAGRLTARLRSVVDGFETVVALDAVDHERARLRERSRAVRRAGRRVAVLRGLFDPARESVSLAAMLAVVLAGGWWATAGPPFGVGGPVTAGTFVTFYFYAQMFVAQSARVGDVVDRLSEARASARRVFGLLDHPAARSTAGGDRGAPSADPDGGSGGPDAGGEDPATDRGRGDAGGRGDGDGDGDCDDPEGSGRIDAEDRERTSNDAADRRGREDEEAGSGTAGGPTRGRISTERDGSAGGRVVCRDLTFAYPGAESPAVDGVTLRADPGEFVGIVGPTGAGKSTLLKLLAGLYEPDGGSVTVGGRPPADGCGVGRTDGGDGTDRAPVGYVGQQPDAFDGTVHENVAYGVDADREAVVAAARRAGAHGFVTDLPAGYDTQIGEDGTALSGGQRQRIAIARALVREPAVLVLDEPTSHVDARTGATVRRRLADVAADRTTVTVAHRLSTVRGADRILVVEDGRVVERGPHDRLVDSDGRYAALWRAHLGAEAPEVTGGG